MFEWIALLMERFYQWRCGRRGHEMIDYYTSRTRYLYCFRCGWRSDGWDLR